MQTRLAFLIGMILVALSFFSCNSDKDKSSAEELSNDKNKFNKSVAESVEKTLSAYSDSSFSLSDSIKLPYINAVIYYYQQNKFRPIWSDTGALNPFALDFIQYLDTSVREGLYNTSYHYPVLKSVSNTLRWDTLHKTTIRQWSDFDLMMTDAFMHVINDVRYGRLIPDSLSQKNNLAAYKDFFAIQLNLLKKTKHLSAVIGPLHPTQNDYQELKRAIRSFSDSMDLKPHTYVFYPFAKGDSLDSIKFVRSFQLRLSEEGIMDFDKNQLLDSTDMSSAIKKYQSRKGITVDGKISKSLVNRLNLTDEIRLKRIFITLDRYKLLRDSFPERYVWVNLPAYHLKVVDKDTIALRSKIICGKPGTQTPLLVSDIDELVTYPTWTVPASIIKNELLPGLKRNSGYLSKKGLGLYDKEGKKVDPLSVNWDNYKAGIPYKVRQSSGDNNALGVMKFNFDNPFSVYLHDTNQRGLFNNNYRALSHGCVRVQEWKALAFYIARVDSMNVKQGDTLGYTTDSLAQWLDSKKRKTVAVKNKVRLFIKYFTCEGVNGKMIFHDDIYDEDKKMIERFFAAK